MNIPCIPAGTLVHCTNKVAEVEIQKASVLVHDPSQSIVREAMNHYYARDAQSLEQLIRRLIHKQP